MMQNYACWIMTLSISCQLLLCLLCHPWHPDKINHSFLFSKAFSTSFLAHIYQAHLFLPVAISRCTLGAPVLSFCCWNSMWQIKNPFEVPQSCIFFITNNKAAQSCKMSINSGMQIVLWTRIIVLYDTDMCHMSQYVTCQVKFRQV